MPARFRVIQSGVSALVLVLAAAVTGTAQQSTPPGRLTAAVLWFADKTGDPELSHWGCAVPGLLTQQLREGKAIRVLPTGAVDYAFRELGVKKGTSLDAAQARKMGELIEAQRVVWGSYERQNEQWQVRASVLNVSSGKASGELIVSSADWFELRDELAGQILRELGIKPSESERQKMAQQWRTSPGALESYSRAMALQDDDKPFREQEESVRKALAADPQFTKAHVALAATLYSQGSFAEAEQAVRHALELEPDCTDAHLILGILSFFLKKPAEAEQELRKANNLDPEDSRSLIRLSELCSTQQKWDEAISFLNEARVLDPTNATVHASLGLMYAHKRDRDAAMAQLKEAERLDPGGLEGANAEQMVCQAYGILGEVPLAVEHHERFVTYAKRMGANPKLISIFEERSRQLKATLTPTFIEVSMPEAYSEQTLLLTLRERLTEDELSMVVDPLAGSAEMKRWAERLTESANGDMQKAKALFEGLTRRIEFGDGHGHRTAKEVFTAWNDPDASFICTEYANLFIALARAVKLKAFYVHVEKDYRGKAVPHDCVAVFVDDRALLVDATYRWFGVPHKEFVILDDVQAIAHHLAQLEDPERELAQRRLAVKLHPGFAWGQFALIRSLCKAEQWDEARNVFESVLQLEPDGWDVYLWRGIFADHDGDPDAAVEYLRKASGLNPESALVHFGLGNIFGRQGKLKEAREEFRVCLRYTQDANTADNARKMIAQINEQIGIEDHISETDQSQADQTGTRGQTIH
ncbi:MAG TPA: tetratricopeptide repeat protein [Sedimentisphaerales bacterium]|nr:tetratricopeptide repeat protein [Sedimentisphaerales bacterium]